MADERSQEELAGGFLRCSVGATTRSMPTLKLRAETEWRELLVHRLSTTMAEVDLSDVAAGGEVAYSAVAPLASMPTDIVLELVLAYDKSGALGGREWLLDNADSGQLWLVLRRIFRVVFPFVSDLRSLLDQLREVGGLAAVVGRSGTSNSQNGHSSTGPELMSGETSTPVNS